MPRPRSMGRRCARHRSELKNTTCKTVGSPCRRRLPRCPARPAAPTPPARPPRSASRPSTPCHPSVSPLYGHPHDGAAVQVHRVLRLVGEVRPPVFHLRDPRIRIVRMGPFGVRRLLRAGSVEPAPARPASASPCPTPRPDASGTSCRPPPSRGGRCSATPHSPPTSSRRYPPSCPAPGPRRLAAAALR